MTLGPSPGSPDPATPRYGTAFHHDPGARPTGVTVLAILVWIGAALALLAGFGLVAAGGAFATLGVLMIAFGLVQAAVGWGLWTGKRWAWYAALVVEGLAAISAVMSIVGGDFVSGLVGLLVAGLIIWYLLKPEVRAWFGTGSSAPRIAGRPSG